MAQTHLDIHMKVHISDVKYVEGVCKHDPYMEKALYNHCKDYFDAHYHAIFFVGDEQKEDIFQESFITLWENIENGKLYVESGTLKGKGGKPFVSSITTYFMAIAIRKFKEWSRDQSYNSVPLSTKIECCQVDESSTSDADSSYDIIRNCINGMSQRCYQILTMFYYQELSLDRILIELPSFNSKNALKTQKYKCLENLKKSASEQHHAYLNSLI